MNERTTTRGIFFPYYCNGYECFYALLATHTDDTQQLGRRPHTVLFLWQVETHANKLSPTHHLSSVHSILYSELPDLETISGAIVSEIENSGTLNKCDILCIKHLYQTHLALLTVILLVLFSWILKSLTFATFIPRWTIRETVEACGAERPRPRGKT